MALSVTTGNVGSAKEDILELMVLGNEAVEKGSIYINDGVQDSISMSRMSANADPLQDRVETPSTDANAFTYDEKKITPRTAMFFDRINPRNFEQVWRQFQPKGPLVAKVLDPKIQNALLSVLRKQINKQIGKLIWQGDTTAGATSPLRFFDGLVTLAAASSDTVDVTNAGLITEANVQSILNDVSDAIPNDLYDDPDMCYHMSTADFRKYQNSVIALTYKGQGPADQVPALHNGRKIKYYSGLPANTILAGMGTADAMSNFQAAVDMVNDTENVVIEKWRPESELFFVKVLFKMAVQIGWNQETVLYQGTA